MNLTLMDVVLRTLGLRDAPAAEVLRVLEAGGNAVPELKPLADALSEKLRVAASEENVSALIPVLQTEVENIKNLKLDPRDHPSDA